MDPRTLSLYVMAALYMLAGLNHFRVPQMYQRVMPPYIPWPRRLDALAGLAEIVLGLGLLSDSTRAFAAWGVIALLVAVSPVHVHMIQAHQTKFKNVPLTLLWLRLPLQLALMAWAWMYTR